MCGRYYIEEDETSEQLRQIIAEAEKRAALLEGVAMKKGEIFPANVVPIISQTGYDMMKWGYTGFSAQKIINARSETVREKAVFRSSLAAQRCLVPANGYFEWQHAQNGQKKQKFAIYTPGEPIFMAGLWRQETSEQLPVFVILTRDASEDVASIHNRMPVILPKQARHAWVRPGGSIDEILEQAIGHVAFEPVS